ncbi:MAG: CBS domain-containing protein [Deltaproteobacteria bacterium]|nr:CBS domain-containing protein [Deltaproteobacteria bacterium]MBW1930867.1 CBS domain-containing protein [Deltaproteobacteria bacterium]MBW2026350.1 CBS domain-containing protein [Deltaproteobacteria bacterium]MBW2125504.1 CBS domain-containing protein [Deltaproteobacteria bacterium]
MKSSPDKNNETIDSGQYPEEVITTHINADFDALASMIAAKKLYPQAVMVFPGAQEKNLRNFFLHSASYLFNFAKLKQIKLEKIKRLILVDTRQRSRIGKFADLLDRPNVEIHVYDHHPGSEEDIHGNMEIIRQYGANTTILTQIIREKGIPVSPDEATLMCLGIHEDTGSFTFSSTTPEDYEAAAWLTKQGANHNIIADMLTRELTAEQIWLLNDLTKAASKKVVNGVEIVTTKVVRDEYVGDFAVLVHKLMEMENLNVVFALAQMEDRIYLVARSRIPEVNVGEIAAALGGGGHPQAASATIKNKTLAQVERSLNALLRNRIQPTKKARDMMSSPVIFVPPEATVKRAANLMTRYNINVLLVIEDHTLKGYITRQVVEKAVFFGLEDIRVSDYMNIEFSSVPPEAPLKEVQDLIIKNKLRVLPVVDHGEVVGVITRTDLLNILVGEPLVPDLLIEEKGSGRLSRKKSVAGLLKERLPRKIIERLKNFGQVADMLGYNAYLVGGLVRDVLLHRENFDVDIVIEGDGIVFAHEFAKHFEARVRSHKKFGTAVLIFPDGFKVDVATARMEYYESPGSPPIVQTSSLRMDLYRRDFTINTLAIKLNKRDYGTLIDYFGGQRDIKEKVIRVLHNLSFVEDPTRVFRAIRFEQRFGFKIGKLTLALIKNAVKINALKEISGHRLFMELKLILGESDPIKAIERMNEFDLLQFISPEITFTAKLKKLLEDIKSVISWYRLLYLEEHFEAWKVYWYGLTSSLDPKGFSRLMEGMGMADTESKAMVSQRERLMDLINALHAFSGDNYTLYTLLSPYDTEILLFLMAKSSCEKAKRLISTYFTKLKGTHVELSGKELIQLGMRPGPIFKKVFEQILERRLNQQIQSKEDEITFVKERYKSYLLDKQNEYRHNQ